MNVNNIKFAKEVCFNIAFNEMQSEIKQNSLIEYQLTSDELFVVVNDKLIRVDIVSQKDEILNELSNFNGRSLMCVDKINQNHVAVTLFEFYQKREFDKENPLNIIVDQAIMPDLRKNKIEEKTAVNFIKKQILLNEKFCFAFGNGEKNEKIELLGEKFSFQLQETPQHYLHIIGMRPRNNKSEIHNVITLISGCIEITDRLTNTTILTEQARKRYLECTRDNQELIALWDMYDKLDLECIKTQAKDMGFLKYSGRKLMGSKYVFDIEGGFVTDKFLVEDMYYGALSNGMLDEKDSLNYSQKDIVILGSEYDKKCEFTSQFIIQADEFSYKSIPESGYLVPSYVGSQIQSKRRSVARTKILNGTNQLIGLNVLLQTGEIVGVSGKSRKPVSDNLEKVIFGPNKKMHFTEKQKEAIKIAINTPDIAVIQGPPGTGKTTIIRAIIARINEIEGGNSKILVTSTQHDAVDNAIEKVSYGGLPVNRVGGKKNRENDNLSIFKWIDDMVDSCNRWIDENSETDERKIFRRIYSVLEEIEENSDYTFVKNNVIKIYKELQGMDISSEIFNDISKLLRELDNKTGNNSVADSVMIELKELVEVQRTNKVSFLDDGILQIKKLESFIRFNNDKIKFEIPLEWKKLKRITEDEEMLEQLLEKFGNNLKEIEDKYLGSFKKVDEELIKLDIMSVLSQIKNEILERGESQKDKLVNIIWDFKQELSSNNNIKRLINSYSNINAATCQQAASKNISLAMNGLEEKYDYVIIDEAARSNPLDLLIPMCMGKKIILVGDHKQLPHMVEKDIIEKVVKKTGDKSADEILEQSLFKRLFDLVAIADKTSDVARTCMLHEQYRMHPEICELINVFYNGNLKTMCKEDEKAHNLGVYNNKALVWLDMPPNEKNRFEDPGKSKYRKSEIDRIIKELYKILSINKEYDVGIITFYSKQAKKIHEEIEKNFPGDTHRIFVGTVDAFQGKEFDIVFLSTVRSNQKLDLRDRVGFLTSENRLCVAFSRAKRLLIAVGDSTTVAGYGQKVFVKPLKQLLDRCQESGYYE